MRITVLMSFKRNGELLGQPRITFQSRDGRYGPVQPAPAISAAALVSDTGNENTP
jgi:hypothetical protein